MTPRIGPALGLMVAVVGTAGFVEGCASKDRLLQTVGAAAGAPGAAGSSLGGATASGGPGAQGGGPAPA